MVEYINLETGEKLQGKSHADALHKSGVRIQVLSDGVPVTEWVPNSYDYYSYTNGEKHLHRFDECEYLNSHTAPRAATRLRTQKAINAAAWSLTFLLGFLLGLAM